MSSINPHFTFQYAQPEDYKFSHDSVFLARRAFEDLRTEDLRPFEVLDLCAGCGIIGLDFLFHCQKELGYLPLRCDFLEVQEIYAPYFSQNSRHFPSERLSFQIGNYEELISPTTPKYDLILCNPPYFRAEHGKLSPSDFKNRCRFFIDSDLNHLFQAIEASLKPEGQAFVLLKDLQHHGVSPLNELATQAEGRVKITPHGHIRGTDLVVISRR